MESKRFFLWLNFECGELPYHLFDSIVMGPPSTVVCGFYPAGFFPTCNVDGINQWHPVGM